MSEQDKSKIFPNSDLELEVYSGRELTNTEILMADSPSDDLDYLPVDIYDKD